MLRNILRFIILFVIVFFVCYSVHRLILDNFLKDKKNNVLDLSYVCNAGFTLFFTAILIFFRNKLKDQIGFIFLIGSFLKITIFLILFRIINLQVDKTNFLDFFIPYSVFLSLEVYIFSKLLKQIK